jgi:hypothetical protein
MRRSDRLYEPIGNPINPITKMPIYGDPVTSLVGKAVASPIFKAVAPLAGSLVGGLMGGADSAPQQQQAPGFTPYGITTGFGTSTFDNDNKTASYTLSDEMKTFRDQYYGAARSSMPTAEQLDFANQVRTYGQGVYNQASGMDTQQMTQDYFNRQQQMLQPSRMEQSSQLADQIFGTGRTGLGVGMGQGYVNPQQFALAQAREQQNAQLLLGAEDRARGIQQGELSRGLNTYGLGTQMATDPYNTANTLFGYGAGIENLGKDALTIGSNIGSLSGQLGNQASNYNNTANQQGYLNNLSRANSFGNMAGQAVGGFGKLFSNPQNVGIYDPRFDNYDPVNQGR